jgi:hypothetical protein
MSAAALVLGIVLFGELISRVNRRCPQAYASVAIMRKPLTMPGSMATTVSA